MTRGVPTDPTILVAARKLRTEDRMSIDEIKARTGVPIAILSKVLSDIPLNSRELEARRTAAIKERCAEKVARSLARRSKFADIIRDRVKSTDQKGAVAEAAAIFRLKAWGLVPHLPLCQGGKSDIAVYVPETGRLLRVQVKWAGRADRDVPRIPLRSEDGGKRGVRYAQDAWDFLVGYDAVEDICYVYAAHELNGNINTKTPTDDAAERWDKLLTPVS
jgi:hypothetical protein